MVARWVGWRCSDWLWSSRFQPLALRSSDPYIHKVLDHLELWLASSSWLHLLWHTWIYSDLIRLIPRGALNLTCNSTAFVTDQNGTLHYRISGILFSVLFIIQNTKNSTLWFPKRLKLVFYKFYRFYRIQFGKTQYHWFFSQMRSLSIQLWTLKQLHWLQC